MKFPVSPPLAGLVRRTCILLTVAIGTCASQVHAATATASLAVSSTVASNCTIDAPLSISFGAYAPSGANASTRLDGTGTLRATCTLGTTARIGLSPGDNQDAGGGTYFYNPRRMTAGTGKYLRYSLFINPGQSTPWDTGTNMRNYTGTGLAEDITIYAVVPPGQNVAGGDYADTIVASIVF